MQLHSLAVKSITCKVKWLRTSGVWFVYEGTASLGDARNGRQLGHESTAFALIVAVQANCR
ncbi:hypothetical protein COO20_21740 [Thalassospira marina]|uniref:Uncharacterized protein n=1 Tax=Thalassospira marina TaxID=2048283 RepID=A0A2N3KGF6_9PROT|nr:hypothetical protein COO20_21740 [Thalassospira marina]